MRSILPAAVLVALIFAGAGRAGETSAGRIQIVSAHLRGRDVDQELTDDLRQLLRSGVPGVAIVTQTLNHTQPAPGWPRTLELRYSVNGKLRHATFHEGEKIFFRDLAGLGR